MTNDNKIKEKKPYNMVLKGKLQKYQYYHL